MSNICINSGTCISGEHQYKVSCSECYYGRPDTRCQQCLNVNRCGDEKTRRACAANNFKDFKVDLRPVGEWITVYVCSNCGHQTRVWEKECPKCHALMGQRR